MFTYSLTKDYFLISKFFLSVKKEKVIVRRAGGFRVVVVSLAVVWRSTVSNRVKGRKRPGVERFGN